MLKKKDINPIKSYKFKELPEPIFKYLHKDISINTVNESVCLLSTNTQGWPHTAQLSLGEIYASDQKTIKIALWSNSNNKKNIEYNNKLSLVLAWNKGIVEIQGLAKLLAEKSLCKLTIFEIKLISIIHYCSNYANVISGISFIVHDPQNVNFRWKKQRQLLVNINEKYN
ncbi:PNPOx family protein [Candidatus Ishikawella capsulata]|uniref:Pyridoxamine 5'-phosphate oxidase putative domain-containing protein n=1 Tax=Candidatus Ishikawaella capsulata Mpkobe TaxID=476281 RepID=C5WCB2_9ENTR|nr:hypothetical protein [Candidatus Ishikawaella capsulata]BAH82968.1 hypothetical protein ICMP_103 [Candidatus Ishikawaella capsulata Mpkobe]